MDMSTRVIYFGYSSNLLSLTFECDTSFLLAASKLRAWNY